MPTTVEETAVLTEVAEGTIIDRMFKAGAHFGYTRSRRHPSMTSFIFGSKNRVDIFDLEKTSTALDKAKQYMETLGREGKTILLVGGKQEAQALVERTANTLGVPYVASRWLGGTLTNFHEIKKRLDRLELLRSQRESGELEKKYTKKERLLIDREITRLEAAFGGIVSMKSLPQALVIIDAKQEAIAVAEAHESRIPVIALMNSDSDRSKVTVPVIGNDGTVSSIAFFLEELAGAYTRGRESK